MVRKVEKAYYECASGLLGWSVASPIYAWMLLHYNIEWWHGGAQVDTEFVILNLIGLVVLATLAEAVYCHIQYNKT
jgi:hypothetical protein